jgi:DNA polymerase-3 subunit delta
MTPEKILEEIQNRKFRPIYFLQGEESYYIDLISDALEKNVLTEAEKGFNQTVLYGKDVELMNILNAAKRFPMMSEYQLIIVKEAQNIKFSKGESKEQDVFNAYLENPLKSTILVFCHKYGTLDKRLKISKLIEKSGLLVDFKKLYENKVPEWVVNYLKHKGFMIDAKAAFLVAEFLGNDLSKISNELDKLCINVDKTKAINIDDIEKNIGISKDYNVFELTNALAKKDVLKANKIIDYFAANKKDNPIVLILGNLNNYFSKIFGIHFLADKSAASIASNLKVPPYIAPEYLSASKVYNIDKTCQIINLLREYDLRSKGVDSTGNTEEGELLKELVWKILH